MAKSKFEIPIYDPQTGQLNPHYEELTGKENPLKIKKEKVMNWKPIGDQVLLKVEKTSEKTKSGIILVDRDMSFVLGKVIATGDGLFTQTGNRIPMTVKEGDAVYVYKSNLGENKDIVLDDEQYVLVRESEIAVVCTCGKC